MVRRAGRGGRRRIYWDSCVSLRYVNETPENKDVLDSLLADSAYGRGDIEIVTSLLANTEVVFALHEQTNHALDDDTEQKIDSLWKDHSAITVVELYPAIALQARGLIRMGIEKGWSLKPYDAIHLATAQRMEVDEFHTYDTRLHRYSNELGFPNTDPFVHGGPPNPQGQLI